jgi:predicted nucleotidyltransferase
MVKKTVPKKVEKNIKAYIDILKADKLPISRVILFGSRAKGRQHKCSDIDLCVISPEFKDPFKAMHYLLLKSYNIDAIIEPHPYHPRDFVNEDPLVWEIKQTGIEMPCN